VWARAARYQTSSFKLHVERSGAVYKYASVIVGRNHTFHREASGSTSLRLLNSSTKEVINKTQHAHLCAMAEEGKPMQNVQ
jgi:hypothetical protein